MIIKAFDESNNGILKSNYSSISIPLRFPAFQDCIEYHMSNDHQSIHYSEHLRESVGCRFVKAMPTNITSLSVDNTTIIQNRTKECSWSWTEGDNRDMGGVFEVTMKTIRDELGEPSSIRYNEIFPQVQTTHTPDLASPPTTSLKTMLEPVVENQRFSGSIPKNLKPVNSDVMLALTCDACFKQPCVHKNKDSRVTFAIPFILKDKPYMVEHHASPKGSNAPTILLPISLSFLLFIAVIIILYQWLKRSRDKR